MDVKSAAKALECSPSLIYALIEEGRLRCLRLGRKGRRGKIVIKDEHLQAFVESTKDDLEDD